jgi:hypothetical protein
MGLFDHDEVQQLKRIAHALERNADETCELIKLLRQHFQPQAHNFKLFQLQGDVPMAINGVQAGASGVFQESLIPGNAAPLQSGPSFASTDTNVTLTQDTTDPSKVTAAVAAGDTAASFDLTVTGTTTVGTITHTFTIPIIAAPPPQAVDFDLNQLS